MSQLGVSSTLSLVVGSIRSRLGLGCGFMAVLMELKADWHVMPLLLCSPDLWIEQYRIENPNKHLV